ncbi:hypothetical protein B0I35DRAFT_484234 [Stachybotrys elegans]|uniref:Enoyl reductase (ER) domain-containing protein n=1 Tax=Stachybotrys elegans TaxID=80388 RepID=A0A8K0WKY4_9HYPO|nr:hypothetical protein B0I35DRAFT_484234 [Stachybotrys elegans]
MAANATTMKAWIAVQSGRPRDILQLNTTMPLPAMPGPGQIMVQVSYAALNPGDIKMMAHKIPFKGSTIPGMDFVGKVVQMGPSIASSPSALEVGSTVAGTTSMMNVWRGIGILAEYVVIPANLVVEKPEGLDEHLAAGLFGVVGQTSFVLTRTANLRKGDKALINGASGGVGSILTQALRAMGVRVTAVSSAKNEGLVRRLGAEEFVDYQACTSLPDYLSSICAGPNGRAFDAIFDCVGNDELFYRSPTYLQVRGKFLSIEAGPFGIFKLMNWPLVLGGTPRTYQSVFSRPSGDHAEEVLAWFNKGWIKEVPVDSIFEMEDAIQAFEKLATQRAAGKIIIRVVKE